MYLYHVVFSPLGSYIWLGRPGCKSGAGFRPKFNESFGPYSDPKFEVYE